MTHYSHNQFHIGDNLIHLHFLRKLAQKYPAEQFVHAVVEDAHQQKMKQLREVIGDVPNVTLIPFEEKPLCSVNVWKNAGATIAGGQERGPNERYVPGFWEQHRYRNNFAEFYIDWFQHLARGMGLESPITRPKELWFDYPAIQRFNLNVERVLDDVERLFGLHEPKGVCTSIPSFNKRFDFLVVNSRPCSGQLRAYDSTEYLTPLIEELAKRYSVVVTQPLGIEKVGGRIQAANHCSCTMDHQLTISDIGALSLHADYLLMVSTGPSWPTFNVWNADMVKLRLLLLDTEKVDYMPNTVQVGNREEARAALVARKLL